MLEVSVRICNEEQTYTQKFLVYDTDIVLSKDDPKLSQMVNDTIKNFKGNVDDVIVKIKFTW